MNKSGYISILIVALVVLCPFQCIVSGYLSDVVGGPSVVGSSGCGCCGHSQNDSREPGPITPDDCPCGDCFCRGALPVNDISDDQIVSEMVSFLTCWVSLETEVLVKTTTQVDHTSFLVPVDASALDMRACLSCWIV